jgi:hypothetical protein
MEMGTGKTKVAIDWAGIGFHNTGVRRVLVVAPLSVLGVWPRQIRQHLGAPASIYRLEGSTRKRCADLTRILRVPREDRITFVLINYEAIWREPDRGPGIEALLRKWNPDLVIFDESHRIKSPQAKQSKAAWRIARESEQRLLLTGTPITKAPLDIFGQFRALDHHIFGENWYAFKFTYGIWGGFGKYQLRGYRNLNELIGKVRQWKDFEDEQDDDTYEDDGVAIPSKIWTRSFLFNEPLNDKDAFYAEVRFGISNTNVNITLVADNAVLKTWAEDVTTTGVSLPLSLPFSLVNPQNKPRQRGLRGLAPFNEAYIRVESTTGYWSLRNVSVGAFVNTIRSQ